MDVRKNAPNKWHVQHINYHNYRHNNRDISCKKPNSWVIARILSALEFPFKEVSTLNQRI